MLRARGPPRILFLGKCDENVVAASSVAEIYYSVTLQAHSGKRDREKESVTYTEILLYYFLCAHSTTRDSVFQVRLHSLFVWS